MFFYRKRPLQEVEDLTKPKKIKIKKMILLMIVSLKI